MVLFKAGLPCVSGSVVDAEGNMEGVYGSGERS